MERTYIVTVRERTETEINNKNKFENSHHTLQTAESMTTNPLEGLTNKFRYHIGNFKKLHLAYKAAFLVSACFITWLFWLTNSGFSDCSYLWNVTSFILSVFTGPCIFLQKDKKTGSIIGFLATVAFVSLFFGTYMDIKPSDFLNNILSGNCLRGISLILFLMEAFIIATA